MCHRAGRVRNLFRACFLNERAGRVWNLLHSVTRNLTADRVGNLLVADFRNHAGAGHSLLNGFRAPFAAADRSWRTLNADGLCAAGVARINYALLDDRARNAATLCDPFSAADINGMAFRDWLADRVAHVFVTRLSVRLPGGAAHVTVAGLVDRLADVVAAGAVAGLVDWLADGVAAIAIARLVARLADAACDVAIAGLIDWLADVVGAGSIAGLIDRFADGVALVAVAGFVHVLHAGDRNGFRTLIEDRFHAGVLLGFPDNFPHCVTLRSATALRCNKVARG